jgi:hypothetical protein
VRFNVLELLAHNLLQGGKATANQCFMGEGLNPLRIDQQHHKFRGLSKDTFFLALRVSKKNLFSFVHK